MSFALVIKQVDGKKTEGATGYVPIATEQFFITHWEPLIERLGLNQLAMILPGLHVTEEDLPIVLAELRQLQRQLPDYYAPESDQFQYMNPRLTALIAELNSLAGKQVELYLG